jgi:hypothetical protein
MHAPILFVSQKHVTLAARLLWTDRKLGDLIYSPPSNVRKEIERHIHVALLCVLESAEHRPDLERVVTMLNNKDVSLPKPMQPAYFHVNPSEEEVHHGALL